MPAAVTAALAGQDSRLLLVAAGSLLSLAAMAAVTANRVGAMNAWFPLHIYEPGVADKSGSPATLWRLPLGLAMLTIMNVNYRPTRSTMTATSPGPDWVTSAHPFDRMDCVDYDRLVVTGKFRFLPLVGWMVILSFTAG